jgi:hypothetical protein
VLFWIFASRYSFTIGHQRYLALRDGPRRFPPNSTWSVVLGIPTERPLAFRLRGCHPVSPAFQCRSARRRFCDSLHPRQRVLVGPTTPKRKRLPSITPLRFRLFPVRSPLLREYLFLRVLRCFRSPRALHPAYLIQRGVTRHDPGRVAPFGNPRITACAAAPRDFSQLCHALHRPLVPRHPPCALSNLTKLISLSTRLENGGTGNSPVRDPSRACAAPAPPGRKSCLLRALYLSRCSHSGDERIRTAGLLLAKQALCQLSYIPGSAAGGLLGRVVGLCGFEPQTSRLSAVRSDHLS